ncbi:Nephrocystin-3-like protein 3 [Colletotrichum chlorophyti]|uniref:Nephrocystin-3-like protein 3 n=1 Tax=Colletotrichum chlorophyti TaxID=708187 RepID=A0A1Q8RCM7_9PEZI|nr:Nephrocystin-3-like protein 3 [Colletotrichum chlorophyti]
MATSKPRRRQDFQAAIICALPLEYDAAVLAFDEVWDGLEYELGKASGDRNTYTLGKIGQHDVVLVLLDGMGKVNAASATANLRSSYVGLKLAVLCGICGGVPNPSENAEILLGDVIISRSVVQYDLGKQYSDKFARKDSIEDSLGRPSKDVRSLLTNLQTNRGRFDLERRIAENLAQIQSKVVENGYWPGYVRPGPDDDVLFEPTYLHRHRDQSGCTCSDDSACESAINTSCDNLGCDLRYRVPRRRLENVGYPDHVGAVAATQQQVRVFVGRVGTGDTVVKSGLYRDKMAQEHGIVAYEMEGAGVWDEVPCVIIKAVCDYADSHKHKKWQGFAAASAASATKAFLRRYVQTATPEVEMNPDFVGRGGIMDRIKQLFGHDRGQSKAAAKTRTRVALYGLGGVGKTQIAMAYAYWFHENDPEASVFWVHASNPQRFRQAFTSIAQECRISGRDDPTADILLLVKNWLETNRSRRWLLLIDNADDIQHFFPLNSADGGNTVENGLAYYIPECPHGSVLVTTRDKQTGVKLARGKPPVEVNRLTDDEAEQLLCSLLEDDEIPSEDVSVLASQLEHLPLALAQAASYIIAKSISIPNYIRLLESDSGLVDRLSEHFETVGRDSETPHALTATWLISFKQIEEQNPLTGDVLCLISLFDRQAIPREFIYNYCFARLVKVSSESEASSEEEATYEGEAVSENPLVAATVTDILGTLQAFSFISKTGNDAFDMHRLVQLVTRKRLVDEQRVNEFARNALNTASSAYPKGNHKNWDACLKHLPHALAILSHPLDEFGEERWKVEFARLSGHVGHFFNYRGQYSDAELHHRRALEIGKAVLGEEHRKTIVWAHGLAETYLDQLRLDEAEELLQPALDIQIRILGHAHSETLSSKHLLAMTFDHQAHLSEAEKLNSEVLEVRRGTLGEEDGMTLATMTNLAHAIGKQGRLEEAEELYSRILEIETRTLGEEHLYTLTTKNNIAVVYERQGRLGEAEQLHLQAFETRRKVSGLDDPVTLVYMSNLGYIYQEQGRLEEARQLQSQVLELRKRVLGRDHHYTLDSMASLATIYHSQHRFHDAEELVSQVFEARRRALGKIHHDTLRSAYNLAVTWWSLGRHEDAISLMRQTAQSREQAFGPAHEDTVRSKAWLSEWEADRDGGGDLENDRGKGADENTSSEDDSEGDSNDNAGVRL